MRMFSGLRSRWMTPIACAAPSASSTASICGARSGAFDQVGDGPAFRELHRVPGNVPARIEIVNRHDRGMRQLRGELGFTAEPADGAFVARDLRMQQLEGDLASQRQVAHTPDRAK